MPDIMVPSGLAKALEMGLCRYVHLTMEITVPPSTGGTPVVRLNLGDVEKAGISWTFPATEQIRMLIRPPPRDFVWKTFGLTFGILNPEGFSRDFVITHGQFGMISHEDPWLHSLADKTYPHVLTLMRERPEIIVFENNEALAQTCDLTIHLMAFEEQEEWEAYLKLIGVPGGRSRG